MKTLFIALLLIVLVSGCTRVETTDNSTAESESSMDAQGSECEEINNECCRGDHCIGIYDGYCQEQDETIFLGCDLEGCLPNLDCKRTGELDGGEPPPGEEPPPEGGEEPPESAPDEEAKLPPCEGTRLFTRSPIDMEDIYQIYPLGGLGPPGHTFPTDHIYFWPENEISGDFDTPLKEVPVYSPGDIMVTQASVSEHIDLGYTDYTMFFSPCEEIVGFFIHISSVSEELEDIFSEPFDECHEYSSGDHEYRNCHNYVERNLSAGDVIDTAGRRGPLDLGVYDNRTTNYYANPVRWDMHDKSLHTVCPIDYFTTEISEVLEPLLGGSGGMYESEDPPVCGTIYQDIGGTAQGIWFTADVPEDSLFTFPEDPHLALVHDAVRKERAIFSVGTSGKGLPSGQYNYWPETSGLVNRDFGDIVPGEVYCFETENFWGDTFDFTIILELTDETNLRIEKRDHATCGSGPWSFSDPALFKR